VYALWVKGQTGWVLRLVHSFLAVYRIPPGQFQLVNSGLKDNGFLTAGYYIHRLPLLAPIGLYLVHLGLKKEYGRLVELVRRVKSAG